MMALATRYEVSAQVASSIVEERSPAMCSSETLTTVVSSTSMKVLNITAMATIQGLIWRSGTRDAPPDQVDQGIGVRAPGLIPHAENPAGNTGARHVVDREGRRLRRHVAQLAGADSVRNN